MEAKYYTPEISEFYVGFEFEMRNSSDDRNHDWEKCTIKPDFSCELDEDFDSYSLQREVKEDYLRVKYLDEADILELGFVPATPDFWKNYPTAKNFVAYQSDKFWLTIDTSTGIIEISIYEQTYFKGKIKNKSELKKVLDMITS